MIARGLLSSPRLIVMDEPTNHLDIRSIEALQDVLRHCACALVLVSHDERFLDALADVRWMFEVERAKKGLGWAIPTCALSDRKERFSCRFFARIRHVD